MIIRIEEYHEIIRHCKLLIESFELPSLSLCDDLQMDYDSLVSICNQLHVKQTKKLLPLIEQDLHRIAQVLKKNTIFILSLICCSFLFLCVYVES